MGDTAYCPRCGAQVMLGARFCTSCRYELLGGANAAPGQPSPPAPGGSSPPPVPWAPPAGTAEPGTGWTSPQIVGGPPPVGPPPFGTPPPHRRSNTALLVGGAVTVVVVGAAVIMGFFLLGRSDQGEQPPQAPPEAAAPSPIAQPGIDVPVSVEGQDLQITSAELADSYTSTFSDEVFRPTSGQDTLLIVEGTVQGDVENVHDWKVAVTDDGGERNTPGVTSSTAEGNATDVDWVFVVDKSAGSFVLELPGAASVELAPLLEG
jgi:hypothetical protein